MFVIPQFAKFYASFNAKLPAITLLLLNISEIATQPWFLPVLIPVIGLTIFALSKYINTPNGREIYDRLKLKIWQSRAIRKQHTDSRFCWGIAAQLAGVTD